VKVEEFERRGVIPAFLLAGGGTMQIEPAQPMLRLDYQLGFADALAYESRPRELRGWRKLVFFVWIALAGAGVALLPEGWTSGEGDWRFWFYGLGFASILYGIAVVVMTFHDRLRAQRRLPRPVDVVLEQWGDHLAVTENGGMRFIAFETISTAYASVSHAIIVVENDVVIVPRRAFAEPGDMEAFAAFLDAFGADD
jgi:hypothetical protein